MDSEEFKEVREARAKGLPETDEGPYYHKTWWEGYKGGVKGLLGGLLLGTCVGSVIGAGAGGLMLSLGLLESAATIPAIIAAFAAGGMLLGAEEFSTVGIVTGANAAAHEEAEIRSKKELGRAVGALKAELAEIKALVQGKPEPEAKKAKDEVKAAIAPEETFTRTTHADHNHSEGFKPIFWKVAAIGAVIGGLAGALLAYGQVPAHLLDLVGHQAAESLTANFTQALVATTTVGAMAGASFGINRDIFRRAFDLTDHWFRGILIPGKEDRTPRLEQEIGVEKSAGRNSGEKLFEPFSDSPARADRSDTHFRDKLAAAQKALAEMDQSQVVRH